MDKVEGLISVLLDTSARIDERDDAAMDLGNYDDDRALDALVSIATNHQEEPYIMYACGESITELWIKRNNFNPDLYNKMVRNAQFEIYNLIKSYKPEWIKKYNVFKKFDGSMHRKE